MNVIASYIQGCSGAMVEYLLHNLKVEGSRYTAGKLRWGRKLNRKSGPHAKFFCCYMYELSQWHPVWVAEIYVMACNSVVSLLASLYYLSTDAEARTGWT
jgi:hypothetical protein